MPFWTDPESFHITLLFLGNLSAAGADSVFQTLENVCALTQTVGTFLRGLGLFEKSGALWVGIDASPELLELQQELTVALNMEPGRFHAHFTLGRIKGGGVDEKHFQTLGETDVKAVPFDIDLVELVKSELLQQGACHTVLGSARLR